MVTERGVRRQSLRRPIALEKTCHDARTPLAAEGCDAPRLAP